MSVLCCDPVIFDDHIDEIDQYLDDLWDWNKNKSQNQSRDYLPRHPKNKTFTKNNDTIRQKFLQPTNTGKKNKNTNSGQFALLKEINSQPDTKIGKKSTSTERSTSTGRSKGGSRWGLTKRWDGWVVTSSNEKKVSISDNVTMIYYSPKKKIESRGRAAVRAQSVRQSKSSIITATRNCNKSDN